MNLDTIKKIRIFPKSENNFPYDGDAFICENMNIYEVCILRI